VSAMHPSKTYKGCAMCKMYKRRGLGKLARMKPSDRRRAT
jgi:hypothetical protein